MQPSNEDSMTVLHENTVSEDRKELRRETSKLSAIKQDTEQISNRHEAAAK
jgi:hypothetical protein